MEYIYTNKLVQLTWMSAKIWNENQKMHTVQICVFLSLAAKIQTPIELTLIFRICLCKLWQDD